MTSGAIQQHANRFSASVQKLPPEQWSVYREVLFAMQQTGIPFAVGGGLAAMAYASQFRDSKDLDLYIEPESREQVIEILGGIGFTDLFEERPYDRKWIHRTHRSGTIVDAMWAMANQRSAVDRSWLLGPLISVDGLQIRLLRPEETLWSKLYVMQRDRCDWPDALNMLSVVGPFLDWKHLMARLEDDVSLLGALLCTYGWLCPDSARLLPAWVWKQLQLTRPASVEAGDCLLRARLLDSRPWFTPTLDDDHRLSDEVEEVC